MPYAMYIVLANSSQCVVCNTLPVNCYFCTNVSTNATQRQLHNHEDPAQSMDYIMCAISCINPELILFI